MRKSYQLIYFLNNKSLDLIGSLNFTPNKNFNIDYSFSLDNDFSSTNYNLIKTNLTINKFVTTPNFYKKMMKLVVKTIIQMRQL